MTSIVKNTLLISGSTGTLYTVPSGKFAEAYPQSMGRGAEVGEVLFPDTGLLSVGGVAYDAEVSGSFTRSMGRDPIILYEGQTVEAGPNNATSHLVVLEFDIP